MLLAITVTVVVAAVSTGAVSAARDTRNMWAEDDVLDAEAEATVANMRWFGSVRDPDRRLSSSVEKAAAQEATGAKFAHLHAGASRFDPPARRASRELLAKPLSPRSPGAAREHVYDLSLTGMASLGRREDPTIVLVRQERSISSDSRRPGIRQIERFLVSLAARLTLLTHSRASLNFR